MTDGGPFHAAEQTQLEARQNVVKKCGDGVDVIEAFGNSSEAKERAPQSAKSAGGIHRAHVSGGDELYLRVIFLDEALAIVGGKYGDFVPLADEPAGELQPAHVASAHTGAIRFYVSHYYKQKLHKKLHTML